MPFLLAGCSGDPIAPRLASEMKPPAVDAPAFAASLKPIGCVLKEPGYHIWCNSPVYGPDGKVHLFVSRWPMSATFGDGWWTVCEIARYEANNPEGPWTFKEVVLKGTGKKGDWRGFAPHNVEATRLSDGRYALTFIANSTGARTKDPKTTFPANQKIGIMVADTPEGPWKPVGRDGLVLSPPEDPTIWSHDSRVGVNNPSLFEHDGKFFLYYKAMRPGEPRKMGLAVADKVEGPYRFEPGPLTNNKTEIEDCDAFMLNGRVALITTDSTSGGGLIWSSDDGKHFDSKPVRAYTNLKGYVPEELLKTYVHHYPPYRLERPKVLLDPKTGRPAYLFVACGTVPKDDAGTRPFVFKIESR